jgi:hypothetical protein
MRRFSLRVVLPLVPAALMFAACGGAPQEGLDSAPEAASNLGTSEAGLSAAFSCSRTSNTLITCTATPLDGVGPYTYLWGQNTYMYETNRTYFSPLTEGSSTRSYFCYEPGPDTVPTTRIRPRFQLQDATGTMTGAYLSAQWYECD